MNTYKRGHRAAEGLWNKIQKYYTEARISEAMQTIQDVIFDSQDLSLYLIGRHPNSESDIFNDYDELLLSRQAVGTEPCIFGPRNVRKFAGFTIKAYETIEE